MTLGPPSRAARRRLCPALPPDFRTGPPGAEARRGEAAPPVLVHTQNPLPALRLPSACPCLPSPQGAAPEVDWTPVPLSGRPEG